MPYTEVRGIRSYYEQHGSGEPVLLLHGGFCSIETWSNQIPPLARQFRVHAPERPGHGRTPDRAGAFGFEAMLADSIGYLDAVGLPDAHVVGFSDGAIIGILMGVHHPDRVRSLVSISANVDTDAFVTDGDVDPPADEPSAFRDAYARLSPDGPEHADAILAKLTDMWQREPHIDAAELARITAPTLVMAGERDSITTEHTIAIAKAIPGAQLCIVPGAGHMSIQERAGLVNLVLTEFLAAVPPHPSTREAT